MNQFCIASGIFYTNTYAGTFFQNGSIHKVDLSDNSFVKVLDNAILHDVKEDQSTIIYSNVSSQYGYNNEMESDFIIKNFYNYDTLSISGYDARFNFDGSKIIFTSSFTEEIYESENFSSLDIYSTDDSTIKELSDSVLFGYYLLSANKNKVLWTEKNNLMDSLNIHIYDINLDQTDILDAKLPYETYGGSLLNNLFWGKNNILFASLSDTNNTKRLYSLDMNQNAQSFSELSSFDTTGLYMILNTQDFNHGKFLFSRMIPPDNPTEMYHLEIWTHDIYNEVSDYLFNFSNGQIPLNYFWTFDTSDIYLGSALMWGMAGNGPFYHYDLLLDNNISLSETYRYPLNYLFNGNLVYFDNNINTAPLSFELLLPSYNETIELYQNSINDSTTFSWSTSQDLEGDSLIYTFHFWDRDRSGFWLQPPVKIYSLNSLNTSITLSNEFIYNIFMEALDDTVSYFKWSVDVTDGLHVLSSDYDSAYPISYNYTPTINPIDDQEIEEDTDPWFFVTGTFYGSISDYTLYAYSDTADFYVIDEPAVFGGGWRFELIPNQNWFGEAIVTLILVEDESGLADTTSFQVTVLPINDSPEPFSLIYPIVTDTISINTDTDETVPFTWGRSMDVDSEVIYKLTITLDYFGTSYTNEYENIADTTYGISAYEYAILMTNLNLPRWKIDYTIEASDGEYTIMSNDGEYVFENTSLSIENGILPKEFALHQNYPNPFNPITSLRYDLPNDGLVNITVHDMMGRVVKTFVNGSQTAGFKSIQWNATNDRNEPVSAGLYLYTIQAGEFRQTKKMVLLK